MLFSGNPILGFCFPCLGGLLSAAPKGASLQLFLQSAGRWCKINPRQEPEQRPVEVNNLLRNARCAARGASVVATTFGTTLFVAIAFLVLAVSVLAAGPNFSTVGRNTTSWHTLKSSRMECGSNELVPAQTEDSRPALPTVTPDGIHHFFFPLELPALEVVGFSCAHGLRAPPLV